MKKLQGITVLVTRPAQQSGALCQRLCDEGAKVVPIPALRIEPSQQTAVDISDWDWVFFVSANAVRFFEGETGGAKVVAIGEQTAEALRRKGISTSLVPAKGFTTEDLVAMPELESLTGQRCLIVRGDGGRGALRTVLETRGAMVQYLEVYRRVPLDAVSDEQWQPMLASARSVAMFTSGDSLRYFRSALMASARDRFDRLAKIVGSGRIAEVARETNHPASVIVTAHDPSDNSMMNALYQWAEQEACKQ